MKSIINKTLILILTSLLITSCATDMFNRVKGNRNVTIEKRKISNPFSTIKVSNGLNLYLTQGNNISLTVEADENLHDIIKTEVTKEGKLHIYSEKNIWKAKARKIHLTFTNIQELITSSGSNTITENTLKASRLKVSSSSGSNTKITIATDTLATSASSGASLTISGTTKIHITKASSGASVKAFKLKSNTTVAKASSGASIGIYTTKSIKAKASSGASIKYSGNPEKVDVKKSSGGSVNKK